jgi:competence protein ComFC
MKRALDGLYPPICELCGCGLKDGKALCEACEEKLPRIISPFCASCGESFFGLVDGPFDCPNCRDISFNFEFALAAMDRCEETLELIHRLKYGKEIHLADALGKLACGVFSDRRFQISLKEKWLLVPVPLHHSRLRKRQFNQAQEIARVVAKQCELPMLNVLKRVRKTASQTRLSRRQRLENLKKAFELRIAWKMTKPSVLTSVRGVILVDDVFTTGSTVDACAKILRKAGVKRVAVLTVLRG